MFNLDSVYYVLTGMCVCVCVCLCVSRALVTTIMWILTLYVLRGASHSLHLGIPLTPALKPSYQSKIITLVINVIFISMDTPDLDWVF